MIDRVFNVFKTSEKTALNMEDNQKKKTQKEITVEAG